MIAESNTAELAKCHQSLALFQTNDCIVDLQNKGTLGHPNGDGIRMEWKQCNYIKCIYLLIYVLLNL